MRFAIYGSRRQEPYIGYIRAFFEALAAGGHEAVVHPKLYNYLLHYMAPAMSAVVRVTDAEDFTADYAVSIGGDGSFLRTAAWVGDKEIPVIGVNTGHLGYLTTLPVEQLPELPTMLAGAVPAIEDRSVIAVDCAGLPQRAFALNEVAISKADGASIIDINASIDGMDLGLYRADGLLISTPTGSTAYNLSVGGPVVQPSAPVMVLSPIAAHSLSIRPLVVADTSVLTFCCDSRKATYRLAVDGHSYVVGLEHPVTLTRAPYVVRVALLAGCNFASTLRNKLSWK